MPPAPTAPAPDPAPAGRPLAASVRRNLPLDLVAAMGVGITTALVGSLLPSVARREGLDPIGLAILAASPFLANLLGAFAGRVGPRTTRHFSLMRATGALLLVLLVLLPAPTLLAAVTFGFWLTISFGIPMQHRIWAAIYPAGERGRYLGLVTTGRTAAAGTAALIGGIVADRIGGLGAIAIAGGIGAVLALSSGWLRAPIGDTAGGFGFRESMDAFRRVPALRRVAWAQVFYGGGLIAAGPLYALVQVDRLSLSLAEIGTIGVTASIAATLSCLVWGALSDRYGGLSVIQVGTCLGALSILCYATASSIVLLWVAALLIGVANGAMETAWPSMVADHTSLADRAKAVAGLNALTGARGLVAPFVGSILVQAGIVDVAGALVLCAIATATGAALYLGMRPSGEPRGWYLRADDAAHRAGRRARRIAGGRSGR